MTEARAAHGQTCVARAPRETVAPSRGRPPGAAEVPIEPASPDRPTVTRMVPCPADPADSLLPSRSRSSHRSHAPTGSLPCFSRSWRVPTAPRRFSGRPRPGGLVGESISVRDLDLARTDALVRVALPDGRELRTVLRGDRPGFVVPPPESPTQSFARGLRGGVSRLAGRVDALLFVAGLVLLARDRRGLAVAVAAFVLANGATPARHRETCAAHAPSSAPVPPARPAPARACRASPGRPRSRRSRGSR